MAGTFTIEREITVSVRERITTSRKAAVEAEDCGSRGAAKIKQYRLVRRVHDAFINQWIQAPFVVNSRSYPIFCVKLQQTKN